MIRSMRRLSLFLSTVLLASFSATAQFTVHDGATLKKGELTFSVAYEGGEVQNQKLASKLMGRELPYRIILPARYSTENSSERFPVIYLLHGLSGHFDNWTDKTRIASLAESANFIIVTPEGEDGWYTDSATKYDSYIIKELVPEIDKPLLLAFYEFLVQRAVSHDSSSG